MSLLLAARICRCPSLGQAPAGLRRQDAVPAWALGPAEMSLYTEPLSQAHLSAAHHTSKKMVVDPGGGLLVIRC